MRADRWTDKLTNAYRHIHHNTLHPNQREVINYMQMKAKKPLVIRHSFIH